MKSSLNKKLGLRIRELRISKNIKQGEFADLLDMERSNFTRIESGKQAPTDKNLEKISKILNVEIKDLYDFAHLDKNEKELKKEINEQLKTLTLEELKYCFKMINNLKQIKK